MDEADTHYEQGCELEEKSPELARRAYERAIALNPRHADAHINLGRLFHEHGYVRNAEHHYRLALAARPDDPTATFNLAIALDDQRRVDEAIDMYTRALTLDSTLVDAYFNLARLYEKKGEKVAALRHLKDYKRLAEG